MEREDEIAGVGNSYTAKFWQYDSRTGRKWNQDPRPNPSISRYGTFALNPVMFSDVMGDTVVGGNAEMAQFDELEEETTNRLAVVQSEYDYYQLQGDAQTEIGKVLSELMLEDKSNELNELQSTLIEIDRLKSSEQIYVLEHRSIMDNATTTTDYSRTINGLTYLIPVIVKFNPNRFRSGYHNDLAHELKHCYQFDNLQLSYNSLGEVGKSLTGYTFADEIEAYTRGFYFGTTLHIDKSVVQTPQEINAFFVLARGYDMLLYTSVQQSYFSERALFFMKYYNQKAWDSVKYFSDFKTFSPKYLFKGWRNYVSH